MKTLNPMFHSEYDILTVTQYFKKRCQGFISMLIPVWSSFCLNYCISGAWHGSDHPLVLLRSNASPGCFDSDLKVICIVVSCVSHFPFDNTPLSIYWVQIKPVCWPIKHIITMVIEPDLGSVGRWKVLLENAIIISIKCVNKRKQEVL